MGTIIGAEFTATTIIRAAFPELFATPPTAWLAPTKFTVPSGFKNTKSKRRVLRLAHLKTETQE
ncbi:hypothetical protein D3C83_284230 [compost metagenome]